MQERKKRRIVIASVLKPIDDTRMFEKMGQSLASQYDVHIVGYPSSVTPQHVEISFHPLRRFGRLSLNRILAPWKILLKIFQLRPSLLIITTHELLLTAAIGKLFLNGRIVYDVRENYFRNILHTNAFPKILRGLIAGYVRLLEGMLSPFVDHFFLAEKGYELELSFPGNRKTILENKFKRLPNYTEVKKNRGDGNLHFLFSGTLAEATGVFVAIDLVEKLHQVDSSVRLTICGYCAQPEVLRRLQAAMSNKAFVNLIGGHQLVPHDEVVREIQRADVGIVSYGINPSTTRSIPTKLYEYMGCHLPILLIDHQPWTQLCERVAAAVPFQLENFNAAEILKTLRTQPFYTNSTTDIFWESEEGKMMQVIHSLLGDSIQDL